MILTCFAGRRRNMELLLAYSDRLHSMGLIDEMHIWDFTRDPKDSEWLSKTFQKARLLSMDSYNYQSTGLAVSPGLPIKLAMKCPRDAHILLTNKEGEDAAEISLGAYNNSCSFLRGKKQGETIAYYGGTVCGGREWRSVEVAVESDGQTTVRVDDEDVLCGTLPSVGPFPLQVSLAGWRGGEEVRWMLSDVPEDERNHPYARLFHVKNKGSWMEYYAHYTTSLYPNHVIIKSDDDIVFIDFDSFERFIEQRMKEEKALLLFPNIVNNGLCAGHQYSMGYIGEGLGSFQKEGTMGRLWGDGKLCMSLHRHFIENHAKWIAKSRGEEKLEWVPLGCRISINFFAILSKDLFAYQMLWHDDEREITVEVTKKLNRRNMISMNMTVAHLAFYKQRDTGLDEAEALDLYRELAGMDSKNNRRIAVKKKKLL